MVNATITNITPTYYLYGSEGCHLCELALAICQPLLGKQLQQIDIVDDETLVELYGVHIPVLKSLQSGEQLFWPFERQQVMTLINAQSA